MPFESPFFALSSDEVALVFIFSGSSGLFVPFNDAGFWPLYRWTPGWEPYAQGTLLDQLTVEVEDGYSCGGTALPVCLSEPIPGSQGAVFADDPLLFATDTRCDDGKVKRLEVTVSGPLHVLGYRVNGTGDPVTPPAVER